MTDHHLDWFTSAPKSLRNLAEALAQTERPAIHDIAYLMHRCTIAGEALRHPEMSSDWQIATRTSDAISAYEAMEQLLRDLDAAGVSRDRVAGMHAAFDHRGHWHARVLIAPEGFRLRPHAAQSRGC